MSTKSFRTDVCIYGGTPGAIIAALEIARSKKSVCLVSPDLHLGGILVEGLGSQDIDNHWFRNSVAIGGLAREFYQRIGQHYGIPFAQKFEPHVAEKVFLDWLKEYEIKIVLNRFLDSCDCSSGKLRSITLESGEVCQARLFIDGTIEGDLLKAAGVSMAWGRESNSVYGERSNGIQKNSDYRQFRIAVDPYRVQGKPSSGVLPTIRDEALGTPGDGDQRIMAFCFRHCLTNNKANQIPFFKPCEYDPNQYEIYRRYFAAGGASQFFSPKVKQLPNEKTDMGSWHDLSANLYGENYDYPDGSRAARKRIYQEHLRFVKGLFYFLVTDSAVPSDVREKWTEWGLAADEFTDNEGWPRSLYIRCGRRMISDYVITESDSDGSQVAEDPIAVAFWPPDLHHCRRIIREGRAYNEGFVFKDKGTWKPFGVSYRSLIPKRSEGRNLLTPTCVSSSYVGYGAVRLEWTFMALGQAAGVAAVLALAEDSDVQDVCYRRLKNRLLERKQVVELDSSDAEITLTM
ncbi:MAG: FAD-dependent oxidoreductase [Verrucomicrobiota bacterium]